MATIESLAKLRLSKMSDEEALAFISNLRYIRRTNLATIKTRVKRSEVLVKANKEQKKIVTIKSKQERLFDQLSNLTPSQIAAILKGKDNTNG